MINFFIIIYSPAEYAATDAKFNMSDVDDLKVLFQ